MLHFLKPENVKAVDPRTVTFTTEIRGRVPGPDLEQVYEHRRRRRQHDDLRLHGNGTGPFMQEQFEPNAPVRILRKNPNYWDEGLPKEECLRITVAQEPIAAVSAMKAGEVDLVLNVDPSLIPSLQNDPNVELLETGASNSMTVSMWVDTPPFDDVRVRQALKLVVDRQAMIDTVLLGFGEAGRGQPGAVGRPRPTSSSRRNPISRRKLLAEAGHEDELKLDLYTAEGVPGMVRMAQVFAEQAKPAGFNINVIVTPADSYWDDTWLKQPFLTSAWSMRPPEGLAVAYTQDAKWKETHWEHPEYDALLLKANTTVDPEERNKLYQSRAHARRGGRRDHPDVRPPGAGDAPGLLRLRAARAELQPELRDVGM